MKSFLKTGAINGVLAVFLLTIVNCQLSIAQDTLANKRANRAALYSAVVPGLGQAYNKKYWKLPVLYGGFAILGVSIEFNHRFYKDFQQAYRIRTDEDPDTVDKYADIFPDNNSLAVRRDYYRRTRDFMWILSAAVYSLQIIDAYVDAHLADFDISDDLTLRTAPSFQVMPNGQSVVGMKFVISR